MSHRSSFPQSSSSSSSSTANYPPPHLRPVNLSHPLDSSTIAYIETSTSMLPPGMGGGGMGHRQFHSGHGGTQNQDQHQHQHQHQHSHQENQVGEGGGAGGGQQPTDVAGVLRRNQACLNCRRRKLKCDAVRPHCGTCVRSHKHALRTAPRSNPILNCDYDDGTAQVQLPGSGSTGARLERHDSGQSPDDVEDDAEVKKRKRKSTAASGKRKDDPGDSRENELMRRIQELEAQVKARESGAGGNTSQPPRPQMTQAEPARSWSSADQNYQDLTAPSPTALLDILSSAATAQAPAVAESEAVLPGLRSGASEDTMMSGSTGLTPFFTMDTPHPEQAEAFPRFQEISTSTSSVSSASRRQSDQDPSPAPPPINPLSPNNVFTFSPGPSGPAASSTAAAAAPGQPCPVTGTRLNQSWETNMTTMPGLYGVRAQDQTEAAWRGGKVNDNSYFKTGTHIDISCITSNVTQTQTTIPDITTNTVANEQIPNISTAGQAEFVLDETMQQQLLMDLFWPGWPPNMPEPNIVNDLVEAFFDLVPNLPRLLHRARFLARLALPPTHSNFPHPSLLHAICACAGTWCSPAVYAKSSQAFEPGMGFRPDLDGKPEGGMTSFASRQIAFAKDCVQDGLDTGNRLFDVVRAMIILSRVFIDDTRMLECWTYCGLAARLISPLGLNVRSAEYALKSVMLPPPIDALEREERRVAVWMAFYHDTVGSAASGWGTSISLDELTAPLPVSAKDFESGNEYMEPNPQDLESADLWTKHPVVDPFVMCMKSAVILNRATRFIRKWKNRRLRDGDDLEGMQKAEFKELANAIACFQMSFPPSLRNPCKLSSRGHLDIDLIAAHMIPHAAIISLYEPFADVTDLSDNPTRRMIGATQSLVGIIQQVAGQFHDGGRDFSSVMHSSASISLVTAARTSMLFYRQAMNMNDQAAVESHRMDIEMVRMALNRFGQRFKIGRHHAQLIEYFVDRTTNPTMEKLAAHYPEHPRPGAPELHANSDLGLCIMNALNIKRGYWKLKSQATPAGISPLDTPDSGAYAASATGSVSGASAGIPNAPGLPGASSSTSNGNSPNASGTRPMPSSQFQGSTLYSRTIFGPLPKVDVSPKQKQASVSNGNANASSGEAAKIDNVYDTPATGMFGQAPLYSGGGSIVGMLQPSEGGPFAAPTGQDTTDSQKQQREWERQYPGSSWNQNPGSKTDPAVWFMPPAGVATPNGPATSNGEKHQKSW